MLSCLKCQTKFQPKRKDSRFCSSRCGHAYREQLRRECLRNGRPSARLSKIEGCAVEGCDRPYYRYQLCSGHYRRRLGHVPGEKPLRGDGTVTRHGYRLVSISGTQRMEHRVVMEEYLDRKLRAGETVHHRNGVRNDNRIENLELWSTHHPYGQRVADKLAWAREILAEYAAEEGKLR